MGAGRLRAIREHKPVLRQGDAHSQSILRRLRPVSAENPHRSVRQFDCANAPLRLRRFHPQLTRGAFSRCLKCLANAYGLRVQIYRIPLQGQQFAATRTRGCRQHDKRVQSRGL
jgi:hypothetical protein